MGAFRNIVLKLWLLVLGPAVGLEVIQSPSVLSLLRGQTARINCILIPGEERMDSVKYYWCRARDNPGIGCNETRKFLNQSSRVSVSMPRGSLVIREVIVDDSDTYHCLVLREKPRPWKSFTGEGTKLNIEAEPEVSLSADPENEVVAIQTLTCLAAGFFPRDLNMSWFVTGDVSYQTEPGSLIENSDSTYNLSSRLRITDIHWDQGTTVTCQVQHVTVVRSARKSFSHSGDSSIHGKNVDDQIMGKLKNESVNEGNVSFSSETLHYASVHVSNPVKKKQKQELKRPERDQASEYAVLKVKDKNNPFCEESVHCSAVSICPTSNRRQTANYTATT
ncbi:immunoglobulin kappa light chain-like isoform X2 [Heterodontus francisci]|uniref:immunoglobulin kappa light chain-like isoform X2 n=1 Tax=Heterodontus francisci TaxID=7792 RepID=UPI00355BC05A